MEKMGRGSPKAAICISPIHHSVFFFLLLAFSTTANASAITAAKIGSRWTSAAGNTVNSIGSSLTPIFVAGGGPGPAFACGFFCSGTCVDGFLLAIALVNTDNSSTVLATTPIHLVWSANRNNPVKGSAALNLTVNGDLLLSDARGTVFWSSGTANRSVATLSLSDGGNLVLMDQNDSAVWQSYDHPTDATLPGQSLTGKALVANASGGTNLSEGPFCLNVTSTAFYAYIRAPNPQTYYSSPGVPPEEMLIRNITNGILLPSSIPVSPGERGSQISIPIKPWQEFIRLEANGHLRQYKWSESDLNWKFDQDLLHDRRGECVYPTHCGNYGICSGGQCSCPQKVDETNTPYFEPVDGMKLNQGCRPLRALQPSCTVQAAPDEHQKMVLYRDISYFRYVQVADMVSVSLETCKEACALNCSCKASFFKYAANDSDGDCYLVSTVFSIIDNNWTDSNFNSSAYIKVQLNQLPDAQRGGRHLKVALSVGLIAVFTLAGICYGFLFHRRKTKLMSKLKRTEEEEGDYECFEFEHLAGMPTRFSYQELKEATAGFSLKLGEGGFGAVFKGTLKDGTQVAVKVLGYKGQRMKEFLAEVVTIGSIHHLNLVRLVGYCAERLQCLLVYEYMSNGSLDKWIFVDTSKSNGDKRPLLDWDTKKKVILQVARGLSYLHEDCRQRIIHLDIKPQNILLDDNFNAKVSDFGLSKLIDRDQSQVVTTMRGTPGYLAPEWLNSVITEKVDAYSFGVVVLEIVSGKKIIDHSRPQGYIHLVSLLSEVAAEERLMDIIDSNNDGNEALKLLKIAMWCLQMDFTQRPSMSAVVKALEEVTEMQPMANFWVPSPGVITPQVCSTTTSTPQLSSMLSGPR